MRFFVQFFLPASGERDIASITSADIYRWFDALLTANKPGGGTYGHMYESDKINAVRLLDRD